MRRGWSNPAANEPSISSTRMKRISPRDGVQGRPLRHGPPMTLPVEPPVRGRGIREVRNLVRSVSRVGIALLAAGSVVAAQGPAAASTTRPNLFAQLRDRPDSGPAG